MRTHPPDVSTSAGERPSATTGGAALEREPSSNVAAGEGSAVGADGLRAALIRPPGFGGAAVGLLFWWRSLYPTLMPRTWVTQAAISALCLGLGYALGSLAQRVAAPGLDRFGRRPSPQARAVAWRALGATALIVGGAGAVAWPRWQDEQRELVTLDPAGFGPVIPMLFLTAALTVIVVVLGRLVGRGVRRVHLTTRRVLPNAAATPLTVLIVIAITVFVARDVILDRVIAGAESSFSVVDDGTEEGVVAPTASTVSGSPGSLAPWEALGLHGRSFVAGATSEEDLRAFHGADAAIEDPVRVYVGRRTADTNEERAALAVRELERTGAFDREVLVVATSTGSGWIDPDAARAIELMHRGDTAIVSIQYSYLPSWIATLLDPEAPGGAGSALHTAVRERWLEEPEGDRPQLVVFGLSLGSYGAEAAVAGIDGPSSIANLTERTEGALLVGPTNDNLIWRQLTEGREPGSPVWRPEVGDGERVRFVNRDPVLPEIDRDWEAPRILYIQHPTDPVTFWSMDTLWSPPEWQDSPRGAGVPSRGGWFPIVTWLQGVFDLMAGFGAPPGFGHDYRLDYVAGWAHVAPPAGWTDADTDALETFVAKG